MLLLLPLRQAVDEDDDDGRVVGRDLAGRDPNTRTRTPHTHTEELGIVILMRDEIDVCARNHTRKKDGNTREQKKV
jgi:hypothetical protein